MGERSGGVQHHPPPELLVEYAAGASNEAHALLSASPRSAAPLQVEAPGEGGEPTQPAGGGYDPLLPVPLLAYTGASSALKWRRVLPGVATVALPLMLGDSVVRLVRAAPGKGVPMHTHPGQELDLVLQGGLRDHVRSASYEPGDVQAADESVEHRLSVLPGEACILLSVNEAAAEPLGLWSKLVYGLLPW